MTKSILLQTIQTTNGDTDAYEVISTLLEETSNGVWDSNPDSGEKYATALAHLNQLMQEES